MLMYWFEMKNETYSSDIQTGKIMISSKTLETRDFREQELLGLGTFSTGDFWDRGLLGPVNFGPKDFWAYFIYIP